MSIYGLYVAPRRDASCRGRNTFIAMDEGLHTYIIQIEMYIT